MPRFPSLPGRRSREPAPPSERPRAVRRPLPPPSALRRERRALLRVREDRIRALGGLMLEMYRRDHFRQDLLVDRCGELVGIEQRLAELDAVLAAATSIRRRPVARCECGAAVLWGAQFCSSCGRPVVVAGTAEPG